MSSSLFAEEQPIVQRLKEQVPELAEVYTLADMEQVDENQRKFPCAFVIYNGNRPDAKDQGRLTAANVQIVANDWYVVLAVRNVKDQITGKAARVDAGPIAMKVIAALRNWAPTTAHSKMTWKPGSKSGFKAGHLFLPFLFSTSFIV